MNSPFSQIQAKALCIQWMNELDNSLLGKQLCQQNCGRMLGILLCKDGTIYRAFSGQMLGQFTYEGFVNPVFNPEKMNLILEESDKIIKQEPDIKKRSEISRYYWHKIQTLYEFYCFDGTARLLSDIAPNAPAGTGDCCAPRLLSQCFKDNKHPVSMAEFYYGNGAKVHKQFYTPCDERCKPILKYIIGLDIVYLDDYIVVVNKPSGLLSVEGKTEKDCITSRVRNLYNTISQPCVHRLDQATSGLMVVARTQESHDILSMNFEKRKVYKEYTAIVEGIIKEDSGIISLPIRTDINNRPHQIVDFEHGKQSITEWQKIAIFKYENRNCTKLLLKPKTGRTHQLRVHCAMGLKHPIVNDTLYGTNPNNKELQLKATGLKFTNPVTQEKLSFYID